jgi:hypothetical protein
MLRIGPKDEETDSRVIISTTLTDKSCFDVVHSWISQCSAHPNCSKSTPVALPKTIIEVPQDSTKAPTLISGDGKEGHYLALSYCSGDKLPPSLENLPRTFADAIAITRQLGFRYLWIGSLCANHDDSKNQAHEHYNIARYFAQSTLMLSASCGTSQDSGMLHSREIHYSPGLGRNKDRYLRRRNLRWIDEIEDGALATRGWAILERILAPRILHFTSQQMIYECAEGYKFEASNIPDKKTGSGQIRQRYKKSYVQPYVNSGFNTNQSLFSMPSTVKENEKEDNVKYVSRLEAWHQCMDHFSQGRFSTPTDKSIALIPLAQILNHDAILGFYLAGAWSKNIGYSLAWGRVYQVLTPSPVYRAPSWSWASVDGKISSMMLTWSETLLDSQVADPTWINKHGPKLLGHNFPVPTAQQPSLEIKEGSYILLSASILPFKQLTAALDKKNKGNIFGLIFVLDQSWMFDCPCCGEKHDDEERHEKISQFQKETEEGCHFCMIVQGDGWAGPTSAIDVVILRKIKTPRLAVNVEREGKQLDEQLSGTEKPEEYERVGFLRLQLEGFYQPPWQNEDGTLKTAFVNEAFDEMGWERKTVKLV